MSISLGILGAVAKSIASKLASWGYNKITKSNITEYEDELYNIIYETINEFEKINPIKETNKIPFYTSQLLLDESIKFRFTKKFDVKVFEQEFIKDKRIIRPTEEELNLFLDIFDRNIKKSKKLYDLNIECNYKEEVFHVSDKMNKAQADIDEIKSLLKKEVLNNDSISDYEGNLLIRLHEFQSPCRIAAAKGEYESLWVPGQIMDMQWGWERTPTEAEISGKPVGDRKNRLHWILVVKQLVERGYLKELENQFYELTDKGNRVAFKLKNKEEI